MKNTNMKNPTEKFIAVEFMKKELWKKHAEYEQWLEYMKKVNKESVERQRKLGSGKYFSKSFGNKEIQLYVGKIQAILESIKMINSFYSFDLTTREELTPVEEVVRCNEQHCEGDECTYKQHYDAYWKKMAKDYEEGLGKAREVLKGYKG